VLRRLLVTLLLCACSDPAVEREQSAIVGGTPSTRESVVRTSVPFEQGLLTCSGALVAPNLVVTARHCLSGIVSGAYDCAPDGSLVSHDPGAGTYLLSPPKSAIKIQVGDPPADVPSQVVDVIDLKQPDICRGDIAFLVLDQPIAKPYLPIRQTSAMLGEPIVVAGYGYPGNMVALGRYERVTSVTAVGAFTNADPALAIPFGTFLVGPGPCYGDSGGPSISERTGALVGVYSQLRSMAPGLDGCGDPSAMNTYTMTGSFWALAEMAFTRAGAKPWLEGERDPSLPAEGCDGQPCAPPPVHHGCGIAPSPANFTGAIFVLALLFVRRRS
jgi:hypothetical protein